jgi:predicted  nucleic acid-binding Zn-ribbon protein
MPRSRSSEQEIADLENHLATLSRHLALLAWLAERAETNTARHRIEGEIAAIERTAETLRARRRALADDMARHD